MNKKQKEEQVLKNIDKSLIFILIIGFGFYLIYSGKLAHFFAKDSPKEEVVEESWDYGKEPIYEAPLSSSLVLGNITATWTKEEGDKITLNVSVNGSYTKYVLTVDSNFKKVKNDSFAVKTSDTYVKLEGTDYYLYAYNDNGKKFVGLSK